MLGNKQVKLEIETGKKLIGISVLDGKFREVAKGVGYLSVVLPLGLYKINYQVGSVVQEELTMLKDDTVIGADDIPVFQVKNAVIPIQSKYVPAYQENLAKEISKSSAGNVFVFVRSDYAYVTGVQKNSVRILSTEGKVIYRLSDLFKQESVTEQQGSWANGELFSLEPGNYRINYSVKGKKFGQAFTVAENYQTQLFLRMHEDGSLALFDSALSMSRGGLGFDPHDASLDYETCEMAVEGLSFHQALVTDKNASRMVNEKYDNPMLGVYGAYLILLNASMSGQMRMLNTVFRNLLRIMGPQPDVMAIGHWLKSQDKLLPELAVKLNGYMFTEPPMLNAGWQLVKDAGMEDERLVPDGSLTSLIAGNSFNEGALLVWEITKEITERNRPKNRPKKGKPRAFKNANISKKKKEDVIPQLFARLIDARSIPVKSARQLNSAESTVLGYLNDILPVNYVERLADFIEKTDRNEEVTLLEALHISRYIEYMTPEVIEMLKKSLPFASKEQQAKLQTVIDKFGDEKSDYFEYFNEKLKELQAPTLLDKEVTLKLENRNFLDQSLSMKSFSAGTNLPQSSINNAIKGIMDKWDM